MEFIQAEPRHFTNIVQLVTSPEELYLVHPASHYPWTVTQLEQLYAERTAFTIGIVKQSVVAFSNLYQVNPGQSAFIGNVIVADTHKGQGIGRRLIQHMLGMCHDQYQAVAHLSVFAFNTRALLLYGSLGFHPYAVEPRSNPKGEPVALIFMRHTGAPGAMSTPNPQHA